MPRDVLLVLLTRCQYAAMQGLGLLLTIILLFMGLVLNTAVLIFFLVRSVRALLSPRRSPIAPQQVLLAYLER